MKFPIPHGVGEVKGYQQEVRQCYHYAMKVASKPRPFHVIDQQPPSEGPLDDTIDPRSPDEKGTTRSTEDLIDLPVDDKEPSKVLKIGKNLSEDVQEVISEFLRRNLDVFAWLTQTWKESIQVLRAITSTLIQVESQLDKKGGL